MTIKKIHFITGLTITVFVGLHLFNHTLSIFGADRHIEVMRTLRLFYRNIFIETVLLIAVLVQIICYCKSSVAKGALPLVFYKEKYK